MKKLKTVLAFSCILMGLLFANCKSQKTSETKALSPLPSSYSELKDSTNIAALNWRNFFSDSILINLIDSALQNNLDVLMTLQKIEIARADIQSSKGALFPEISATGSASLTKFGTYTTDHAGNVSLEIAPGQIVPIHIPDYYVGLQTTWEVDIWGKLRNKKKAALARYLASIEARNLMITNLVTEVATTYYELISLDNELKSIRETIKLQEDAFSIVTIQKQSGAANDLAVSQFEAQLLNSKALEIEVQQTITIAENRMNFLLGRFPQPVVREDSLFTKEIPVQAKAGIPSDLLQNRPDIRQAQYELIATKADVKAAKAAFYPSLNITGAWGFQAFNTAFLFMSPQSMAYTVIGGLTAPLINRSAIKAQFRTAKANQVDALYNYQKTILNGYVEVYNEIANIKSLQQMRDLKEQEVTVLSKSIDTSLELFKAGKATYLEVLFTQQNSLQSKLELVNIQQQQFNATVNIYKALGGGWR